MRRQRAHLLKDPLVVVLTDANAVALACDRERRLEVLPKRDVRTRDRSEERGLKHRLAPLHAYLRVPEDPFAMSIDRAQIEQRLVDIEDQDMLHEPSAEMAGFVPTKR